ncbi:hypothetical protein PMAYCL1PPCAC_13704, partial [Pristionchus mayeri]
VAQHGHLVDVQVGRVFRVLQNNSGHVEVHHECRSQLRHRGVRERLRDSMGLAQYGGQQGQRGKGSPPGGCAHLLQLLQHVEDRSVAAQSVVVVRAAAAAAVRGLRAS